MFTWVDPDHKDLNIEKATECHVESLSKVFDSHVMEDENLWLHITYYKSLELIGSKFLNLNYEHLTKIEERLGKKQSISSEYIFVYDYRSINASSSNNVNAENCLWKV